MSKFLNAKAPMTAKLVIKEIIENLDRDGAKDWTAQIIEALDAADYEITRKGATRTTRRRQPNIG